MAANNIHTVSSDNPISFIILKPPPNPIQKEGEPKWRFWVLIIYIFIVVVSPPLLLISQNGVAVLACANAPSVNHIAYEDTTITNFASVGYL